MAELDWQKIEEFQKEFGLTNEAYRLGQVVHHIIKKDPDNIATAIMLLQQELERLTTIRK
jgi:hypothetical protein